MASKPLGISIIEFFESPAILNMRTLSPVQKMTLKVICGEDLDSTEPIINTHPYQEIEMPGGFANEVEMFLYFSGKTEYIKGQVFNDVSMVAGRRGGKSNVIGAGLALFKATQIDYSKHLGTSPFATIPIISPTQGQAFEVFSAIKNFILQSPYLFSEFMDGKLSSFETEYSEKDVGDAANVTGKQILLTNKVLIKTLAADIAKIRGFSVPMYILDESAFFGQEGGDLKSTDTGIQQAIEPATAQYDDLAFGLKISSPNGEAGLLYETFKRRKDSDVLLFQVPTWWLNPTISERYLEKQKKKGMHFFNREYGAMFVASENSYLDPKLVDDCVIRGVEKLDYNPKYRYVAAMDYATKDDLWAFSIGHKEYVYDPDLKEKKELVYIDFITYWRGKQADELNPDEVLKEIAVYMSRYRVGYCLADQYAFAALRSLMQKHGQRLKEHAASTQSKLKYMYSLQVAVNSGSLKLVNNTESVKHLKNLREKRTSNGRIKVEHANGTKDDLADVIGLCVYQFDKTSPVYIGLSNAELDERPANVDARGQYLGALTAGEMADKAGNGDKFNDSYQEKKAKEEGEDDEEGGMWFVF